MLHLKDGNGMKTPNTSFLRLWKNVQIQVSFLPLWIMFPSRMCYMILHASLTTKNKYLFWRERLQARKLYFPLPARFLLMPVKRNCGKMTNNANKYIREKLYKESIVKYFTISDRRSHSFKSCIKSIYRNVSTKSIWSEAPILIVRWYYEVFTWVFTMLSSLNHLLVCSTSLDAQGLQILLPKAHLLNVCQQIGHLN